MSERHISLGSKSVMLNEPYHSTTAFQTRLIGRERELRLIMAAWFTHPGKLPYAPLLIGAPGVGKTRLAHELANITKRELYIFWGNEDVTADDLIISGRDSDDPSRRIDYVLSPLGTAMVRGGICFIDELGELRASALAVLLSILDEQGAVFIPLLGERIEVHPRFRLIATMNQSDTLATSLPPKLARRLKPVVEVAPATPDELRHIVAERYQETRDAEEQLLRHFWTLWRKASPHVQPTPSDVIYVLGMAQSLAEIDRLDDLDASVSLDSTQTPAVEPSHLDEVFEQALKTLEECDERFQTA
jgi:MoxR-like ATPase